MKNKRIDNLEFRIASYLCREDQIPEHPSWHIDRWELNCYYGRESDFIKDGEWYRPKNDIYNCYKIHKDCFKHPETCYAIGSFDWDNHEGCYEFRFVGDRPLDLDKWDTFRELIEYGYQQLNPWWYEDDE